MEPGERVGIGQHCSVPVQFLNAEYSGIYWHRIYLEQIFATLQA
jgi:hypothetical protein